MLDFKYRLVQGLLQVTVVLLDDGAVVQVKVPVPNIRTFSRERGFRPGLLVRSHSNLAFIPLPPRNFLVKFLDRFSSQILSFVRST
jgi:hypothetical protein